MKKKKQLSIFISLILILSSIFSITAFGNTSELASLKENAIELTPTWVREGDKLSFTVQIPQEINSEAISSENDTSISPFASNVIIPLGELKNTIIWAAPDTIRITTLNVGAVTVTNIKHSLVVYDKEMKIQGTPVRGPWSLGPLGSFIEEYRYAWANSASITIFFTALGQNYFVTGYLDK